MKPVFAARLALREGKHGLRRVGIYMASITLGVAALVSVHSFRDDVARSVRQEAEVLMGANARLAASRPLPDSVTHILDSLSAAGVDVSRVTTALSMVLAPSTREVRLFQVQAVQGGFPFYGDVRTRPRGRWGAQMDGDRVLVDPAALTQLGVEVGDSLVVGRARLEVVGVVEDLPTDLGFQTAVGPRIHVSRETLESAGLLGFGSLSRHQAFLRLRDREARQAIRHRYEDVLTLTQVSYTLAEERAQSLSNGIRFLGRFLGLVGLGALLLGGIGVAAAIHVYIREKRPGVAVLRCIGADQWTVFLAYLLQATALGFGGALAGVLLGVGVQEVLPVLLGDLIPVEVSTRFSPLSALAGLGIGVWVAVIFALIPLLQVRNVPPLQALRRDFEPGARRRDLLGPLAFAALAASVVALCVIESPEPWLGLAFAGALAAVVLLLGLTALALAGLTRRFFPSGASYPVRQGVSNLFRPRNQTVSVTLALGFGAFIVGTVAQVEGNLRKDLSLSFGQGRPNVLLFDVQPDQASGVVELLPPELRGSVESAPLVPSRIAGINGRSPDELRTDTTAGARPELWALRRQYRNTFRQELGAAEELVAGRWWDGSPGSEDDTEVDTGGLPGVSLERDISEDLRTELGDTITWEVAGREISTVVTSIRSVDWNRLEPNFFAVVEPGAMDEAPHTVIMVARIPDAEARAAFQRKLVSAFPNVSALDFSRVQQAIDDILGRVRQAVAFLGGFSTLAGIVVLLGALAASRVQRIREGALLKTLGARKRQVLVVLLTEYLALGTLATATGLALSWVAAWLLVPRVFEVEFATRWTPMLVVWMAVAGLTVLVGLAGSRGLLTRPPLAVLREAPE